MYEKLLQNIITYAGNNDYKGWDPYDGLNCLIVRNSTLFYLPIFRLFWIQLFKRNPLNLRPLFLVPKGRNPKGVALFASGFLILYKGTGNSMYLTEAKKLLEWLSENYSKGYTGFAWGYNFPWQSKNDFKKEFLPTIVTTSFVAMSFLDGYEVTKNEWYLKVARSSANFMLKDLNIYKEREALAFSYGPEDFARVYNATALGAQLFARLYSFTKNKRFYKYARKGMNFVTNKQNNDGSWYYGDANNQGWIDNFHTGYNLVALKKYLDYTEDSDVKESLYRGYKFFDSHFFHTNGMPNYYHNRLFPIDIHCSAQGIITYLEFQSYDSKAFKKATRIAEWAIEHMFSKKGYFYFQKHRFYTIKIPYMRWSQAWMFYALSLLLNNNRYK